MIWPSSPETGSDHREYQLSNETITKGTDGNIARIEALGLQGEEKISEFEAGRQPYTNLLEAVSQEEGK